MYILAPTHFLEISSNLISITCLVFCWTMVISMRKWSPTIPTSCSLFRTVQFSESLSSSWFKIVPSRRWLVVSYFINTGGLLSIAWACVSEISIALPRFRISCSPLSLSLSARRLSWFDLQFCISCDRISLSLNLQFFYSLRSSVTN